QDLLTTDQRVELRDFLARANVHAVEDGRPKRPAGVVQRQQAGSDRPPGDSGDVAATKRRAVEQLPAQDTDVVPPDAIGVLLDVARSGSRDAVRHDGGA